MRRDIILTPHAKDTMLSIVSFVKAGWGIRSAEKLTERIYKVLDIISEHPYIFKEYAVNNVRKGFISKQTSVIYRVLDDRIEVLFFWDNRQEPAEG